MNQSLPAIRLTPEGMLVPPNRLTVRKCPREPRGIPPNHLQMPQAHSELPTSGFAIEVDGQLKTRFSTPEGARSGAEELKRRFPMLQVRIYDAAAKTRHDVVA
jgi:hypothetical protein